MSYKKVKKSNLFDNTSSTSHPERKNAQFIK